MLEFAGQLGPWTGLAIAAAFAVGTWFVYRRESKQTGRFALLLPLLRVVVVMLIVLMLTGPTLRHRTNIGEPGRVIVFVDASQSMAMTDGHMELARKLLIARSRGWLAEGIINTGLYDAARMLREARMNVEEAVAGRDKLDLAAVTGRLRGELTKVQDQLNQLELGALPTTASSSTGAILREYWLELSDAKLAALPGDSRFLGPPTGTHSPEVFEAPANLGDRYATRIRGYVHPPVSGAYIFWISSDGPSELWLSPTDDPTRRVRIARVTTSTARREWKAGESQSTPIQLAADQRYYIEAIHKEEIGDDHLAVGWQLPIGSAERPIPGRRLSPFASIRGGSAAEQQAMMMDGFQSEILSPLDAVIASPQETDAERIRKIADLAAVASTLARWERTLQSAFESSVRARAEGGDRSIAAAMSKVDEATRWDRVSALLLGDEGLVRALAEKHQIEIYGMRQGGAEMLWSSGQSTKSPDSFAAEPQAPATDLTTGLRDRVASPRESAEIEKDAAPPAERTSVIVLSDGQHNVDAADPQAIASLLGERRVPVYTVGFGSLTRPEDLSIRSIDGPQSVFHEDRVQGEIVVDDEMPPGKPFVVSIAKGEKIVWEKRLITERGGSRRVAFDFAVKELVEEQSKSQREDVKVLSVPLAFVASVSAIEGEMEKGNNTAAMTVQAVTEPRKVLILEGRPRWEIRYLRNLFERDQRWQVNSLIGGTSTSGVPWRRGEERGAFPRDLQSLLKYDVIIFGEVAPGWLSQDELQHIRDFVGERGGGIVFIDGQRGHLRTYAQTPIGELFPVEWTGSTNAEAGIRPTRLKLTAAGQQFSPLRLISDPLENAGLWQELQAPHWLAPVTALPGTEVLVEGVAGDATPPVIVQRSYGAGKVVYSAFDETWRWRYEVGDGYHARFWNQLARQIGEQPFAVQDQFVKLDAGGSAYQPGDKAEIRARLRDRDGIPMLAAKVAAHLLRDGRKVATIPLEAADSKSGSFRGKTAALEPGKYEIAISVEGMNDADLKARAKFTVEEPLSIERRAVVMDEDLLKRMAQRSSGRYYREEDMQQLIRLLEPTSRGRIIVTETALWRSYWWFVPIMLLLTTEWLLRKRAGML